MWMDGEEMKMKMREGILFQGVESGSESESELEYVYICMSYRTSDPHIKIERRENSLITSFAHQLKQPTFLSIEKRTIPMDR